MFQEQARQLLMDAFIMLVTLQDATGAPTYQLTDKISAFLKDDEAGAFRED